MRKSTAIASVASVVLSGNCASVPVQHTSDAPSVISFVASSLRPQFSPALFVVRGRFEGTATIGMNWISIRVPQAAVVFAPGGDPLQWQDLQLSAVLVTGSPNGGWSIASQSLPTQLFRLLGFTTADTVAGAPVDTLRVLRDTLRFQVPIPPSGSLAKTWLAFEFVWPDVQSARPLRGNFSYTYAHSDTLVFARITPR